ncbi:diheme cytochrome c-553 [Polluticaenibacter yanchengensis]|uniref:Diheme cytochrome c-553 n=1 Tax=Polluticaenibacter yanchengensis TaxID=3014562 RepID=A0ABT4UH57_9BACT|nr:diheme cytochrome c-553 [Chitinophagaceae bacterium LY-5]
MKTTFILTALVMLMACTNDTGTKTADQPADNNIKILDSVTRGRYLVTIMGCNDCHTPKVMTPKGPALDEKRLLSGYDASRPFEGYDKATASSGAFAVMNGENTAYAGPWGVSYASNLTSDASGIGNWSLEHFKRAMKNGKYKGLESSRDLLPPMPWQNYINISDEDLECIFAFLKSTTPVENIVPAPVPPMQ